MKSKNSFTQREYAFRRANDIENLKLADARKRHTVQGKQLTEVEVLQALLESRLPRAKKSCALGVDDYTQVKNIWDIHGLDKPDRFDAEGYNEECGKIKLEANKLRDAIMLGDFNIALSSLRTFSEGKY
jgi:hypothetical protein